MQSFASARILRETLSAYVASQQVLLPPGGQQPQPMDVGHVKGWRGQEGGKGKSKGKHLPQKGKGNDKGNINSKDKAGDKFDGWCNNCSNYGPRAKSCWHRMERNVH